MLSSPLRSSSHARGEGARPDAIDRLAEDTATPISLATRVRTRPVPGRPESTPVPLRAHLRRVLSAQRSPPSFRSDTKAPYRNPPRATASARFLIVPAAPMPAGSVLRHVGQQAHETGTQNRSTNRPLVFRTATGTSSGEHVTVAIDHRTQHLHVLEVNVDGAG